MPSSKLYWLIVGCEITFWVVLFPGLAALDLRTGTPASFAHWFMDTPAPVKAPEYGWPALQYELLLWIRCLAAVAITLVLLVALIAFVNDRPATGALRDWFRISIGSAIVWFFFGPLWTLLFSSWRRVRDA
jgi:hypothetical protein